MRTFNQKMVFRARLFSNRSLLQDPIEISSRHRIGKRSSDRWTEPEATRFDGSVLRSVMLKLKRYEVKVVFNGNLGLESALAFRHQVILCDIGLPGMNGFEIALHLRAQRI